MDQRKRTPIKTDPQYRHFPYPENLLYDVLGENIADKNPGRKLLEEQLSAVEKGLGQLDETERFVIEQRYEKYLIFRLIGEKLGVTGSKAQQICAKALRKMRAPELVKLYREITPKYRERLQKSSAALKLAFEISVKVDTPIVVGQDDIAGRRQLIPILSGELKGDGIHGTVLPGGVDSQVIRPDGTCELSARYGVKLDDGSSFYIQNDGIRTVPSDYREAVKRGEFIDPSLYYFCTRPTFEIYDQRLSWLYEKVYVCCATRLPDQVILGYYTVEKC